MKRVSLKPIGMWATPKNMEELQDMVKGLNAPEATHAMMFTWNFISKILDEYYEVKNNQCPCCSQKLPEWAKSKQNPYAEINPDEDD